MRGWIARSTLAGVFASLGAACGSSGSGAAADASVDDASGSDGGAVVDGPRDGGSPSDAGAACDAGDAGDLGRRCVLAMPVTGGLTGTFNGLFGCGVTNGTGAGASLSWSSRSPNGQVSVAFQNGLPTQPGTYPLASLQIHSGGTSPAAWTAPPGACTITVTMTDVECQSVFGREMQVVYGTGTCTQPAAPDNGNAAAPLTVGDFQFEHWL